ncbi:MAG TPA: hypothetical protein VHE35_07185 [Kofleriaceae bacterium]|nr:hypothetical protein [Kofleriaceae bacterium]
MGVAVHRDEEAVDGVGAVGPTPAVERDVDAVVDRVGATAPFAAWTWSAIAAIAGSASSTIRSSSAPVRVTRACSVSSASLLIAGNSTRSRSPSVRTTTPRMP